MNKNNCQFGVFMSGTIIKPFMGINTILKFKKSFFLNDINNILEDDILTTFIKIGIFLNCSFHDTIDIKKKSEKSFFFNLSFDGYIILDGHNNQFKKVIIKEINVFFDENNVFLEIITNIDSLDIKDIEKYINKINISLNKLNVYNYSISYELFFSYQKFPLVIINNLICTKDIEKAILYESIRHEDAIRKNILLKPEIRTFKKNITIYSNNINIDKKEEYTINVNSYSIDLLRKKIISIVPISDEEKIKDISKKYNLSNEIIKLLINNDILFKSFKKLTEYFSPKIVSKWMNIYIHELKYRSIKYDYFDESILFKILNLVSDMKISHIEAINLLRSYLDNKKDICIDQYKDINRNTQFDIDNKLLLLINKYSKQIEEYKNGNYKVLNYIIGNILKEFNGKINAKDIQELLKKKIK